MDSKVKGGGFSSSQASQFATGSRPGFPESSAAAALDRKVTPGVNSLPAEAGGAQPQAGKSLSEFSVTAGAAAQRQVALNAAVGRIDAGASVHAMAEAFAGVLQEFVEQLAPEALATGLFQAIEKGFSSDVAATRGESPRQTAMEAAFRAYGTTDPTPLRCALAITGHPGQVLTGYLQSQASGTHDVIAQTAWGTALTTLGEAAQQAHKGAQWIDAATDGICGLRQRIVAQEALLREIAGLSAEASSQARAIKGQRATTDLVLALISTESVPHPAVVRALQGILQELSARSQRDAAELVDMICKRLESTPTHARAVGEAFGAKMDADAKPGDTYEPLTSLLQQMSRSEAADQTIAPFLHGWRAGMTERRLASGKETTRAELTAQVNELTMAALEQALPSGFDGKSQQGCGELRKLVLKQLAHLSRPLVASASSSTTSSTMSSSSSKPAIHMIE